MAIAIKVIASMAATFTVGAIIEKTRLFERVLDLMIKPKTSTMEGRR